MRRKSKIAPWAVAAILTAALFCGGCSKKLEQPYDYEVRAANYSAVAIEKADPFASGLCVIMDENEFADSTVTSEAAAVFDLEDRSAIYSKNAFERLYPASTTKIMTAIIAIKYGNLSDEVTVTEDAVITESGATLSGIKPGDKLSMEQLLYGLMLPSGNDAGAAIAVHMDGSIEKFSDRMNAEAKKLGATGTHFVNPHGLHSEDHYTTAYDLYLMFNEAMKLPKFREVVGAAEYTAAYQDKAGNPVVKTWKCTNQYMLGDRDTPKGLTVLGGKTGTTKAAGSCLIMGSRDSSGNGYISVIMKAENKKSLYDNMTKILNKVVE